MTVFHGIKYINTRDTKNTMIKGFYTIMAAQFFSSLADNALLIAAIALLMEMHAPEWMTPLLKLFFVLSYVLLAGFVGAFADSFPKGKVMFITNLIKVVGCAVMFHSHPLLAYAIVGLGAAAYSPAKYGILTELLPARMLVAANGWIEGLTVGSIILGTLLGGALINAHVSAYLLSLPIPFVQEYLKSSTEMALFVITIIYVIAALFNLRIPNTGVKYKRQSANPIQLVIDFSHNICTLWKDPLGQISLGITTLFWGAGAVLQFLVLKWAEQVLYIPLDKAAIFQGVVAIGIAFGAVAAAKFVSLKKSINVLPLGAVMGLVVMLMTLVHNVWFAYPMLIIIGALSGFFVVPMNALLQHRGHNLMSAGNSIAVQNFNENVSILVMLLLYAMLIKLNLHINYIIILFGLFISCSVVLMILKHKVNQKKHDAVQHIGENVHH